MATTRKVLLVCNLAGCGHHFECWTETDDYGSWTIHFYAPCPEGEKLARSIAESVAPGKPVTIAD